MTGELDAAFQSHACPTCGHKCLQKKLLEILRSEGSPDSPVSTERIAEAMQISMRSVNTYLYRLRKAGYRLAYIVDEGYFLINDAPDERINAVAEVRK
jgi:biotin operon repressor